MSAASGSETRRYGRAASLLTVGVGMTGFVTYLYFAIASHELSKTDYGEVAILWSAVFITVSTLQRPIEQLLSRTIAEHEVRGRPIGGPMRIAATIQLGVAAVFVAIALILRGPIEDDLLSGNATLYWVYISAVTAYGASYFARGFLAGSHRFTLYALLILSESTSRTMFPLAVALGIASGQSAVALGIVAAPCLSLVVVPFAFTRRAARAKADELAAAAAAARTRGSEVGEAGGGPTAAASQEVEVSGKSVVMPEAAAVRPGARRNEETEFTLAHGGGFAAAVLLIMFSEQTFLNAGPLLIKGSSGAAVAGFMFNILMIARAPIQLFQAVTTSLLPHLTKLRSSGGEGDEETFRASVRATIGAIAAFAGVVALAVLVAGPQLMHVAFGTKFDYDRADLLIVTVGMGLYLSAATLNQAALAQGQVRRASLCWIGCAIAFVIWCVLPVLDEVRRVEVGYLGAATLLCALLYLLYRRPQPRAEDEIEPGSPQELEARLAAADEAG